MLTLLSPAKINLFLKILGKRPDGYHELESLFQTISMFDTLRIRLADNDRFTCNDPYLPTDSTNLVILALAKFRQLYKKNFHVHIHLEKTIPTQAGLGGGSSNAATTLWGINQLLDCPLTVEHMQDLGAEIGSDVPFFFSCGTAICRGRGEIVEPIAPHEPQEVWIVKPIEGLSTPLVYQALKLESLKKMANDGSEYYNDLEEAAFELQPRLRTIKQDLIQAGFSTVLLCGSGTAFFCLGEATPPEMIGVACTKAKFINRHPKRWYQ